MNAKIHNNIAGVFSVLVCVGALLIPNLAQAQTNLNLPNPGFETYDPAGNPTSWGASALGTAATGGADATVYHGGAKSFKITVPNTSSRYIVQRYRIGGSPNLRYRGTVWVKGTSLTAPGAFLRIWFHDAAGANLESHIAYAQTGTTAAWEQLTVDGIAPSNMTSYTIECGVYYCTGTAWFDDIHLETWPTIVATTLDIWGNTQAVHGTPDTLTLSASTPAVDITMESLNIFGTLWYPSPNGTQLVTTSGASCNYTTSGSLSFDTSVNRLRLVGGTNGGGLGTLIVTGTLPAPVGVAFPTVVVHDGLRDVDYTVYVMARSYGLTNYTTELTVAPATYDALVRLSNYLDTLKSATGWLCTKPGFTGQQEEATSILSIANGYRYLYTITGNSTYRANAIRALDWLVNHQGSDGAFGMPWAYGGADGHFSVSTHYTNGSNHPAGSHYAITTNHCGTALLAGYQAFGTSSYLTAATKAKNFLLTNADGFHWLDASHTRGSVMYCTNTPVLSASDPLVAAHAVNADVKNSSVEIYNIDGATLSFLKAYYDVTGDTTVLSYGDALATNLAYRLHPNSSIEYAWYTTWLPSGYAGMVHSGLLTWGDFRSNTSWFDAGRKGWGWKTNIEKPSLYLAGQVNLLGLDCTNGVVDYINGKLPAQLPNGSWTDDGINTSTATDAGYLSTLSSLLVTMGYHNP